MKRVPRIKVGQA